jgi:hypothetical protein
MTDDDKKKALQHYTVQASNASFDATNFLEMAVTPVREGWDEDFRPSGEICGYEATATCKCGKFLYGQGSTPDIAYAIIEGKWFGHTMTSDQHPEETL